MSKDTVCEFMELNGAEVTENLMELSTDYLTKNEFKDVFEYLFILAKQQSKLDKMAMCDVIYDYIKEFMEISFDGMCIVHFDNMPNEYSKEYWNYFNNIISIIKRCKKQIANECRKFSIQYLTKEGFYEQKDERVNAYDYEN